MLSQLFAGDALLETVAANGDRISRTQHTSDPAVGKLQTALLIWDPTCLPDHGADSSYGDETARTVLRFKREELGVGPPDLYDDVGPRTVIRLDEIAAVSEATSAAGFLMIASATSTEDDRAAARATVEQSGGAILLGLGDRAAVVSGGQPTLDALAALVGETLSGVVTPPSTDLPGDLDGDALELVSAWLSTFEPAWLLSQLDPTRFGESFDRLGGCLTESEPA
jgi:hypothetical protein